MPVYCIHRDVSLFQDPDEFLPQRWAENPPQAMQSAWLSFGAGKRNCIGQNLALTEIRTILAALCRDYEWTIQDAGHQEFYVTLKTVNTMLRAQKVASSH
mmetsp:Transcript_12121/g.28039  ORF Transcript_12121/g.28039 Transcript_12121/m.28039 type:complete len:100 (+) Transcript_12121:60-359(+)